MTPENRQKIPVPRRSFLWSLNETSGEILTHIGPTEFTPSANDRIVRSNESGGFESAPMEARPFLVARDGEYVLLRNPVRGEQVEGAPNGQWVPGGNKEKELLLGTTKVVPGPCAFPLWPGQSAEVRPAHKLGANHYLLVEVVGEVDEKARYYKLVIESAGLSSAVIDAGEEQPQGPAPRVPQDRTLRLGQRIVIQGRHTQLFIPPSGIEIVPPLEEDPQTTREEEGDALANLPPKSAEEAGKLLALVREGLSQKQFSTLKNELRHRQDLTIGERAIILSALDNANEERQQQRGGRAQRGERRQAPADPYARRAVVLGPKEFCVLFDADGNPRIVRGPARVFPGPHDTFLHRGSRRRVYDAYELSEHQALWIRIIAPIAREKLRGHLPAGFPLERETYDAGTEFVVRGLPSVFFPFIECEVVHPETGEPHVGNDHTAVVIEAIGIDQKSGVYVRDLRTGMVKIVRGETSYLVDPRDEEHVARRVPPEQWNLWIGHAEPHKKASEMITTPWAISVTVPNNEACLITSRHGRRVEIGPKVVLLDYEEMLTPLKLSKGVSKDGHTTITTCFLRVQGGRVADTFEIESNDFVRFRIKLGFAGHFDGDSAEQEKWFHVEDPVKLLADTVRARVREAAHVQSATKILQDLAAVVRGALFTAGNALRFDQNNMVLDHVDALSVAIVDNQLADLFGKMQRESLELQLKDQTASRRLDSLRHQDKIDDEEHTIVRAAVERKTQSNLVDADMQHKVSLRSIELHAIASAVELDKRQETERKARDEQVRADQQLSEAAAVRTLRDADAASKADELHHKVTEAHRAGLAKIEKDLARALAEADAVRLAAIQKELVGALHAAADAEVMKAAANNMNLVALLGGKSPAELLAQILRGTPLERSTDSMRARGPGNGSKETEGG